MYRVRRLSRTVSGIVCFCIAWVLAGAPEPVAAQSNPEFALDSYLAGDRPAQRISFEIEGGEPEIYSARVIYPAGFSLIGFDDPPGTPVGAFEIEFTVPLPPGVEPPRVIVPLIGLGTGDAFADVIEDGEFSRDLEPRLRLTGGLTLQIPFGGDADPTTLTVPFPGRITLTLLAGPLENADAADTYAIRATITSVDPDTDGADDLIDPAPQVVDFDVPIEIQTSFLVDHASLDPVSRSIGGFRIFGRTVEGAFDLAALPETEVEVTFGNFSQTLAGADFHAIGDGWIHVPGEGGIDRLMLRADGRVQVDARTLDLPPYFLEGQDLIPVPFSLRVGNHRVATELRFDAAGRELP